MKRFILIIALIAAAMNVAAQSDTIVVKENVYDYFKDSHFVSFDHILFSSPGAAYVWCIDVVNNSDENYLTWINQTDNEDGYGDVNQIRNYFVNANPSLFYIWEHFGYSEIMMGHTFLKLIKPKETFTYFVIKNEKGEARLKNRISIVKESMVKVLTYSDFLVSERFEEPYLFNQDSIILTEE